MLTDIDEVVMKVLKIGGGMVVYGGGGWFWRRLWWLRVVLVS
jgi:hypothetical protein